jgi:hypothetical protein
MRASAAAQAAAVTAATRQQRRVRACGVLPPVRSCVARRRSFRPRQRRTPPRRASAREPAPWPWPWTQEPPAPPRRLQPPCARETLRWQLQAAETAQPAAAVSAASVARSGGSESGPQSPPRLLTWLAPPHQPDPASAPRAAMAGKARGQPRGRHAPLRLQPPWQQRALRPLEPSPPPRLRHAHARVLQQRQPPRVLQPPAPPPHAPLLPLPPPAPQRPRRQQPLARPPPRAPWPPPWPAP